MSRDALIVGISSYLYLPPLAAPASDAEGMYRLLLQYGGFDSIKPLPLIYAADGDKFAVGRTSRLSHDELKNALVELFMPQGDRHPEMALFYFSGHGQRHADGIREGYLAVSDSQTSGGNMGISLDWLRKLLAASPVRKQVILLDCCYSGELLSLDEADPSDRGKGHDRCFIAASREYQLAYEQGSGQHGVLTAALLKALDPHSHDSGWVNNHSLAARIREQWQSGIQSPLCTNSGEQIIITRSVAAAVSRQTENNAKLSVLPEPPLLEKICPAASMTPVLASSSGSEDSLEARAETVYGELKPEDQAIAQRLFLRLVQLDEGSGQAGRDSLLTAGMNEESVDRVIKAFGDAGLVATDNGPETESGEAVIKMAQESLISRWPRLRGWLDEHQEDIIFYRRLDAAARHWQEKKRNSKWLWCFSDLKQLKKFAEKNQQNMDAVQLAFFAASKYNAAAIYFLCVFFSSLILCGIAASSYDYFNHKIELRNKQHSMLRSIHRNAKAAKESADQREIHNLSFDILQRAGNFSLQLLPHDEDSNPVNINMIKDEIPYINWATIPSSDGTKFLFCGGGWKMMIDNSGAITNIKGEDIEGESCRGRPDARFSSDGYEIITFKFCYEEYRNCAARLWSADNGAMIGEPMRHEKAVNGALFSSDNTKVLTWSEDGTAKL